MRPISFKRHRFPPDVIRQAVWLYFRFTLSLRDVEELLAARGVDVTYENHPMLDNEVRHGDCGPHPPRPPEGRQHLAP